MHSYLVACSSRWVFIVVLLSSALSAKAQFTSHIDCFFPAVWEGKETKLIIRPLYHSPIIDTAIIANRHATFTVDLPDLSSAYIWIDGYSDDVHFLIDSPQINIAVDPQASIPIVISGSPSSDLWNEQRTLLHQQSEVHADFRTDFMKTDDSLDSLSLYTKTADSLYLAHQRIISKLIDSHLTDASSWFLFASSYSSLPYATSRQLINKFSSFQLYPSYRKIAKSLLGKELGKKAIDFTLPDLYEKTIQLSEINSQYILLNFSSSHMHSCQLQHKALKEVYKQYHQLGLEIITISQEFDKQMGIEQVKKESLPWPTAVITLENSELLADYSINLVPDNLLLDRTKTILHRDLSISDLLSILKEKTNK